MLGLIMDSNSVSNVIYPRHDNVVISHFSVLKGELPGGDLTELNDFFTQQFCSCFIKRPIHSKMAELYCS